MEVSKGTLRSQVFSAFFHEHNRACEGGWLKRQRYMQCIRGRNLPRTSGPGRLVSHILGHGKLSRGRLKTQRVASIKPCRGGKTPRRVHRTYEGHGTMEQKERGREAQPGACSPCDEGLDFVLKGARVSHVGSQDSSR